MEETLQRWRPSLAVLAQLLGQPAPLDWRQRLAQAQAYQDQAQMLRAKLESARSTNAHADARDLVERAAAYEIAAALRGLSSRQLDALSRRASWSELEPMTPEEQEADRQFDGFVHLLVEMIRRLVLLLTLGQVDIGRLGQSEPVVARAHEEDVRSALRRGIEIEQCARLRATWPREAARAGIDVETVYWVESLLSRPGSEQVDDWMPIIRIALDVAKEYSAKRLALKFPSPEEKAAIVFDAAQRHGLVLDAAAREERLQAQLRREAQTPSGDAVEELDGDEQREQLRRFLSDKAVGFLVPRRMAGLLYEKRRPVSAATVRRVEYLLQRYIRALAVGAAPISATSSARVHVRLNSMLSAQVN